MPDLGSFEPPDTITKQEWQRANGISTASPPVATAAIGRGVGSTGLCEECLEQFTRKRRLQRFCSPRCAGKFNARKEWGPTGRPSKETIEAARQTAPAADPAAPPAAVTAPEPEPAVLVSELAAALICGLGLTSLTIHVDRYRIEIVP